MTRVPGPIFPLAKITVFATETRKEIFLDEFYFGTIENI